MKTDHYSVNHGHIIATVNDKEWRFTPSFARIDRIGSPEDIVEVYAHLHSLSAATCVRTAMLVMACCCDDDASELIGYYDEKLQRVDGLMPIAELIILARHLMKHGIVGTAKPTENSGEYSATFDPSEYADAAVIHFGISHVEAWSLTMTQFCRMLDMKFPEIKQRQKTEITPAKYDLAVAEYEKMKARRLAKAADNGN